jgi:hypothetical protein
MTQNIYSLQRQYTYLTCGSSDLDAAISRELSLTIRMWRSVLMQEWDRGRCVGV